MTIQFLPLLLAAVMGAAGSRTVFDADDDVHGDEPWVTDGTERGTKLIKDVRPGALGSGIDEFAPSGRDLWFVGSVRDQTQGIGRTDGTSPGTTVVLTASRYSTHDQVVTPLAPFEGELFFVADHRVNNSPGKNYGIWKIKGAGGKETQVLEPGHDENVCGLVASGKQLIFVKYEDAESEAHRQHLCSLIPSVRRVGCVEFKSSREAPISTCQLVPLGRTVYFAAGSSFWRWEGTTTTLVKEFPRAAKIGEIVPLNGRLLFGLWTKEKETLWSSDGTTGGTVMVATVAAKARDINENALLPEEFTLMPVVQKGVLYFVPNVAEPGSYSQLWRSDGTAAGTRMVKDLFPGVVGADIRKLYPGRDALFLVGNDRRHGDELWKSDGTAAGTVLVKRIGLGWAGMAAKEKAKK